MKRIMTCVLVCLLVTACSKTEQTAQGASKSPATPAAAAAFNAKCPVSGDPVDSQIATVPFKGQNIGFCCANCPPKFKAMSDADKVAALAEHGAPLPQ